MSTDIIILEQPLKILALAEFKELTNKEW